MYMSARKINPLSEMERLFENEHVYLGGNMAIDMFEEDGNLIVEMNIPGIEPSKIDISLEDRHLRISGEREEVEEEKDRDYYCKEIKRGSFERIIRLPLDVDITKTTADIKHGNLRISLPKKEPQKFSKIKVNLGK